MMRANPNKPHGLRGGAAALLLLCLTGCDRLPSLLNKPTPTPTPSPTPAPTPEVTIATPTPAPIPTPPPVPTLPRRPADMAKLFNGITFRANFQTPESTETASVVRLKDDAYQVQITFTATLPKASQTLEDLAINDPKLPHVLNLMPQLIENAKVSPLFERFYKIKVDSLREQLYDLDPILSRHNFYDCETILELTGPQTGRKALLMIGDMDVNVDGSDGDRNVQVDGSGRFFQPQTSYRWPRLTERENPFLATYTQRLADLKKEYAVAGLPAARNRELQQAIDRTSRIINDLKRYSFLISSTDPSIVIPSFMLNDTEYPFAPKIGDYAVVMYEGMVFPAIVGDAGPSAKFGEASLRLGKQINAKASSIARSVSNLKVTYLIFPGTAEPAEQPNLDKWYDACKKYLDEIGGIAPELYKWENTVPAWPTPTPTPTPTPSPSPSPSVSPQPEGAPSPSPGSTPAASPASSPVTIPEPAVVAPPTPAASPSVTPVPAPEVQTSPVPGPAVVTPADQPATP